MEVSLMASSQANLRGTELCRDRDVLGFCCPNSDLNAQICYGKSKICFSKSIGWPKSPVRLAIKAVSQPEPVMSEKVSGETSTFCRRAKPADGVRLYVGLPLDSVSDCNAINHSRAIMAGLKALKLLGVDGVELPVFWGIAEKEAMGKYEWSGYLALAEMVQKVGLKLHVSLCFHTSKEAKIPLPKWVSDIGKSRPSIFFVDRSGQQYKECLSLAVDDIPVLDGKTPIQVYKEFCESFKNSFSPFMGSTITGISVGLGPDGELRYPSHHHQAKDNRIQGAGEFQCNDENMLNHLKQHAEKLGNPLWGLSGPHDAPRNDQSPLSNFFNENGGSWESPYGDFFLSWYSNLLISHGDRLLSLAASTFSDTSVTLSAKVPLVHSWYRTRSHPSELTAGYYNTVNRDGYEEVVEMFSRNSTKMILPGMDLSDENQPNESLSSPELLLAQITAACRKHNVEVSGQNLMISGSPRGFEQIKKNLSGENAVADLFTYQRMGASFFSPDHFPSFNAFVRSLDQPEVHSDDLPTIQEEAAEPSPGKNLQMQAA
ncbi:hypothetical protein RJ639_010899 [Escallonia herrerae]|uniref:Beta-amylase n=1 Tax=Escallonia herrerae TaxID=1293975 RepID=A0AA88VLR3_9ASTE|nr:hypothetical protein RJ639_010899 [Escallonia herrerae]